MSVFKWARRPAPVREVRLPADRPLYIVSDIHLGDGSRSDTFVGKDQVLLGLLEEVRESGAHLVIAGDIIDFPQAITFTRVLRAHGPLLKELSRLADRTGVTYLWGNHDYDITLYRDLLRWEVASSVEIGDDILLVHGHQFDPYTFGNLQEAAFATLLHHLVERVLGTWIRVPLEHFYTPANRLTFWLALRLGQALTPLHRLFAAVGIDDPGEAFDDRIQFWIRSQLGDSMFLFPHVRQHLATSPRPVLVCGHSHLPGRVEVAPGHWYVNSGSWTFTGSQYVHWDGTSFRVLDRVTGRAYGDELYRALLDGSVDGIDWRAWFREEYQGWFRFRCGELRRAGRPLPSWAGVPRPRLPGPPDDGFHR